MKRDPVVLGKDYILPGSDVGRTRPNANCLIVGTTGCGKSTSVVLPTVARMEHGNPILNYAKEADGYAMVRYLNTRGYTAHILNIAHPDKSTISFDPVLSLESYEDISSLASAVVDTVIRRTVDDYWSASAKALLSGLITASIMISEQETCGMSDVLELFDHLLPSENGTALQTPLDDIFKQLEEAVPNCYAVRAFSSWHSLPFRTGSCVRDTLNTALTTVFPESIRRMMQNKPQFDAEHFAKNKEALIVITSAVETSQTYYANLFYRDTIRQLLRYSVDCPNGELPREIRYIFDDFACTAKIEGFANDISLMRSAGLSAILLLQSEQQLEAVYTNF